MKIKLNRYSNVGNNRRQQDKEGEVEWEVSIENNGSLSIKTETGNVYTRKIKFK